MNSFLVILSCVVAATLAVPAQDVVVEFLSTGRARCTHAGCRGINSLNGCPPTNCPPPTDNNCGVPNCNIHINRIWLHPHTDPNWYWQCQPWFGDDDWRPVLRPCACGTLFQASHNPRRCVHPEDWVRDCPNQPQFPILRECVEDCMDCDNGVGTPGPNPTPPTPAPPTPPPPTPAPPVTPSPPGGDCPCICVPCIWWPCMPCATSCPCNGNNQRNQPQPPQRPPQQNPWQRPPQDRWNEEPQHPWQENPWNQPQQPPQNPWQRPNQDRWNEQPRHPWQENWNDQPPQQPWQENPWNQPQQPPQNPWQRPSWFEAENEE